MYASTQSQRFAAPTPHDGCSVCMFAGLVQHQLQKLYSWKAMSAAHVCLLFSILWYWGQSHKCESQKPMGCVVFSSSCLVIVLKVNTVVVNAVHLPSSVSKILQMFGDPLELWLILLRHFPIYFLVFNFARAAWIICSFWIKWPQNQHSWQVYLKPPI